VDIYRLDEVKLVFSRRVRSDTTGEFATEVVTRGNEVTFNAFYKQSRIKEELKECRALRSQTVLHNQTGTQPERLFGGSDEWRSERDAHGRFGE